MKFIYRFTIGLSLLPVLLFSLPNKKDLTLRNYDASSQVGMPATMVLFGGGNEPLCRLAISNNKKYFFLKKINSSCLKLNNSNNSKIICNSNKSVCKTRSELIRYIDSISNTASNEQSLILLLKVLKVLTLQYNNSTISEKQQNKINKNYRKQNDRNIMAITEEINKLREEIRRLRNKIDTVSDYSSNNNGATFTIRAKK